MSLLPEITTPEEYRPIYRDASTWLPAMRAICRRHGLDQARLAFAPPGTHVVFELRPDRYIKLFAPPWRGDLVPERLVLAHLADRTDLPVPRLLAEGEIEGWPYLIMTGVQGVPLCEAREAMGRSDLEGIAARCGEFMAALHATPTAGLEAIATDWPGFVAQQVQTCPDRLAPSGLGNGWIADARRFLDELPPLFEPGFPPVLLSADVTDEHVLVLERGGRWEMTGYIDFGDAMLGHPHYDFVAPGCTIARGSPELLRAMLRGYGYADDRLDDALSDRLMAYTLLHRFVQVPYLLDLLDPRRPTSLYQLRRALWSF